MKKKIILITTIILILLLGSFFYFRKKPQKEDKIIDVKLSNNLEVNLLKLVNSYAKDNYLISPYSIKMALNMLKSGTDNNSYK